jgi:Na+-driven multidrug efflux pump
MSALATILSIWFMVATCAVLFIRGASPRVVSRLERRKVQVEAYPYRRQ